MRKSIWLLALLPLLSSLSLGCASALQGTGTASFEPRSYPYVPELGPDQTAQNPPVNVVGVQH